MAEAMRKSYGESNLLMAESPSLFRPTVYSTNANECQPPLDIVKRGIDSSYTSRVYFIKPERSSEKIFLKEGLIDRV